MYTTSNGDYGKVWLSTNGQDPRKTTTEIKNYREIAETDLMQKTGLKLLKSKIMKEKELEDIEAGEPEPYVYDPCIPQPKITSLNVKAEEMNYPAVGINIGDNPKYMTRNSEYGRLHPTQADLPAKYLPMNNKFSTSFVAERIPDTGLNTFKNPSRVHHLFDS